jgi:two-component system NtrC family sensor kinase
MCFASLPDIEDSSLAENLREHNLGYFICIPLNIGEQRQVLFAARDLGGAAFGEDELETVRILSRQAVVALENARLYDALQDRIRQVEASQQALVQAEKMAAVGRLTASIAHEINNPLHSIRNCLHLAGRDELSAENKQEYLAMASDEMERLMRTVRQMLDFYRPSALDRKPVDINALIEVVLNLLDKQLSNNNIVIHRKFTDGLSPVLIVENQIQQVFFNLILNAMEAMPKGGEIFITTEQGPEGVLIFVEDTGGGISGEIREEIFEPFVSSKEQGLGLGLTVSYGVVTAHEGSLTLLPTGERGACFQLSLPIYSAE